MIILNILNKDNIDDDVKFNKKSKKYENIDNHNKIIKVVKKLKKHYKNNMLKNKGFYHINKNELNWIYIIYKMSDTECDRTDNIFSLNITWRFCV